MVNCDQLLSEASLGWGKSCNIFLARSDWNSGFHGNRELPLSYNGKKLVTSLAPSFLAHLSRRLVCELIVYPYSGVRPSSVVRPSVVHNFKHEYLCNQWANHNEILSEASLGLGKGCTRFWVRSYPNSGFHGNK